jgi:hypothetical protein
MLLSHFKEFFHQNNFNIYQNQSIFYNLHDNEGIIIQDPLN